MAAWGMKALCLLGVMIGTVLGAADPLYLSGQVDVLALENVDSFTSLQLSYEVYKQWSSLSFEERIPFLIDRYFLKGVRDNFMAVASEEVEQVEILVSAREAAALRQPAAKANPHAPLMISVKVADTEPAANSEMVSVVVPRVRNFIRLDRLVDVLSEFLPIESVVEFFRDCDSDKDNEVSWREYLICRGQYDKNGNGNGLNEYDYLENVIISDFTEKLSDPNDPLALELIEKGEL